jgi:hypothetical protein
MPPFEIPSCLVLSRNSGCPSFRGSFGRPLLPEIRFRSLATPVSRCPLDSSIRSQLRLPVAAPVSFTVVPGPRLLNFVDPEYTDSRLYSYNYPITLNINTGVQVTF